MLLCDQVYKPGSVLTAIYLVPQLLTGSSHLLGTAGQAICSSTVLLRDRVYIVEPMFPWAGWALAPPFHPYLVMDSTTRRYLTVALVLGSPPAGVTRYSLPCGARTFLTWALSDPSRGCPTWSLKYCTAKMEECQMSWKFFRDRIYYIPEKERGMEDGDTL